LSLRSYSDLTSVGLFVIPVRREAALTRAIGASILTVRAG
jgi:hypothetical protein